MSYLITAVLAILLYKFWIKGTAIEEPKNSDSSYEDSDDFTDYEEL